MRTQTIKPSSKQASKQSNQTTKPAKETNTESTKEANKREHITNERNEIGRKGRKKERNERKQASHLEHNYVGLSTGFTNVVLRTLLRSRIEPTLAGMLLEVVGLPSVLPRTRQSLSKKPANSEGERISRVKWGKESERSALQSPPMYSFIYLECSRIRSFRAELQRYQTWFYGLPPIFHSFLSDVSVC